MANGERKWVRSTALCAIGIGVAIAAAQAASPDFIGIFGDEGGENYQAVTEITLENGEVVTVVYSQGGFEYLPDQGPAQDGNDASLITLSNPQMSEYFIPGLFGYTAAGGPEVDQNQKVAEASLNEGGYKENRKAEVDSAISTSFALQNTSSLQVVQDFLPKNSRDYHVNTSSR